MKSDFIRDADDIAASVSRSVHESMQYLQAIASHVSVSKQISRQQFSRFVRPFLQKSESIQALEWIPRVPHEERERYETAARKDGLAGFQFTESIGMGIRVRRKDNEEYFPVYYVAPFKGNESAVGLDLASSPTQLEALEKSRETATPLTTARITLIRGKERKKGFLVFGRSSVQTRHQTEPGPGEHFAASLWESSTFVTC